MSTKPLVQESSESPPANIGEEIRRELEKRGLRAPSTDNLIEEIKRMKAEIATSEATDLEEALQEGAAGDDVKRGPVYTADGKGELVGFQSVEQLPMDVKEESVEGDQSKLAAIEQELREQAEINGEDSTGNLLADASHELRSPLQAITGFLELLQSGKVSNAQEARHFLKIAYSESQYLTNRVADLEVASLIATGLFRVKSDPVLINQVIKSCVQSYASQEGDKQILLKEEHLDDLPTFFGDELRIRHALSNIIELVAASIKPGGAVVIRAGVEDDSLWIGIEPKGVLESGKLKPSLKTPSETLTGGTSEGLAVFVTKHIIKNHGGQLAVDQSGGKFVSYRITLPLSLEKKSRGTILITEDNPHTGLLLEFALEKEGFTPIRAIHGSEALNIIAETQIDLIILDAILPGMDGFELCQRIRSSPETAPIPIVMASAKAQEEFAAKALGLGANAYFQKPLSLSKLIPVVEKLIDEAREAAIVDTIASSRED
jgi:CheY-like chemotaxis protein/signal transduction histidine kinase